MNPGMQSYLEAKLSDREYAEIIEDLMIKTPAGNPAGSRE
jgi:hypothetical protein